MRNNQRTIMNNALIIMILFTPILMADSGEKLYQKCVSCHGAYAEKRALGKSKIIQKMEMAQIIDALIGYQTDVYGGPMKTLMQEQVKNLSENGMLMFSWLGIILPIKPIILFYF